MTTLHTLSVNHHNIHQLQDFVDLMNKGDELLLLANGVYALLIAENTSMPLQQLCETGTLYVLKNDLFARGVPVIDTPPQATLISYEGFVDLVIKHQNTYNWV